MSRTLVVVYSNTGTSRAVARLLCGQQGWPMAEVHEMGSRGGSGARCDALPIRCCAGARSFATPGPRSTASIPSC